MKQKDNEETKKRMDAEKKKRRVKSRDSYTILQRLTSSSLVPERMISMMKLGIVRLMVHEMKRIDNTGSFKPLDVTLPACGH